MITELAYLAFEVPDLGVWRGFLSGILGLSVCDADTVHGEAGLVARMDARAGRFFVTEGPLDDCAAVGWMVEDTIALDGMVSRLEHAGFAVEHGTAAAAAARCVQRLVRVVDPSGVPVELVVGMLDGDAPFASELVPGGFVTEAGGPGHSVRPQRSVGLGHAVVTSTERAATTRFYRDLLGFSLSDHIRTRYFGFDVDLSFWHINGRHHSLAFGGPAPKRLHHFMIEANDINAVGAAWDRTLRAKIPVANTLGRHPNDEMFSFYALSPCGVQFEFGWGGRVIDEAGWDDSIVYDRISDWGHQPPALIGKRGMTMQQRGLDDAKKDPK